MRLSPLFRLEFRKQRKTVLSIAITLCAGLGVALIVLLTQRKWPTSELLGVCAGILAYISPFAGIVLGSSAASGILHDTACSAEDSLPLSRFQRFLAAYTVSLLFYAVTTLAVLLIPYNLKVVGEFAGENPIAPVAVLLLLFKMHLLVFVTTFMTRASFLSASLSGIVMLFEFPMVTLWGIFRFSSPRPTSFIVLFFLVHVLILYGIFLTARSACRRTDSGTPNRLFRWSASILMWVTFPALSFLQNYLFLHFYLYRLYD